MAPRFPSPHNSFSFHSEQSISESDRKTQHIEQNEDRKGFTEAASAETSTRI
jgi:hypothetical protein